jgi:hypothetical protein
LEIDAKGGEILGESVRGRDALWISWGKGEADKISWGKGEANKRLRGTKRGRRSSKGLGTNEPMPG